MLRDALPNLRRLCGLTIAGSLLAAAPAQATLPGKPGPLLFANKPSVSWKNTDEGWSIWRAAPDGGGLVQLPEIGGDPAWSPDGSRIAFVRSTSKTDFGVSGIRSTTVTGELWTSATDGSDARLVLQEPGGIVQFPTWSPDGTRIAFDQFHPPVTYDTPVEVRDRGAVRVVNVDGTGARDLAVGVGRPQWLPDGSRILYQVGGGPELAAFMTISPDGGPATPIPGSVRATWHVSRPEADISPDGRLLAYADATGLHAADLATGAVTDLVANAGVNSPVWSPDCRTIAFTRPTDPATDDDDDIVAIDLPTRAVRTLIGTAGEDRAPIWSRTPGPVPTCSVAPPDLRAPSAASSLPDRVLAHARRSGLAVTVVLNEAATVKVDATLPAAVARRLGLTHRTSVRAVRIGSVTGAAKQAGPLKLRLRFTKAAARALRSRGRVVVTLRITATDAAGNVRNRSRTVTLR